MHTASWFETRPDGHTACLLCPRRCVLPPGSTGFCGVRRNVDGRLVALTWGRVASAAVDPVEKKPLYHFHPGARTLSLGTFGCNLRCLHCQNSGLSARDADGPGTGLQELPPAAAVRLALDEACPILVWTYNEPATWFEYVLATAKLAKAAGLATAVVTAGCIEPGPLAELLPYLDAYRLDVKGFTDDLYRRLTGAPVLRHVLEGGRMAHAAGVHVEIVTNVIPGWNDDELQLTGIARWIAGELGPATPWHVTAYHPAHRMHAPPTPVSTLERACALGEQAGLRHIYVGNVPGHPRQDTHCPACGAALVQRRGFSVVRVRLAGDRCPECAARLDSFVP